VRVALIGPVPPEFGGATPGGVATHQVHLAAGLAAAGVDAPLLATNTHAAPGDSQAEAGEAPFPLYRMARPGGRRAQYIAMVGPQHVARYTANLALRRHTGSRREILANLLWYRHFVAEVRPDVIHVQHPLERFTYLRSVQELEGWRQPVIVTAHSLFGEHSNDTIDEVMAPNLRQATRVIAVSPHIAEQAIQLGVKPSRLRVIRSGVDVERFRPRDRQAARQRLGFQGETPLVLFVGNLEPRKQVDVLVRAMAPLRQKLVDAILVVVGSGQNAGAQDQTARLVRLAHELELDEAVLFAGRATDAQLMDYYAAADAFALPSSSEAQGIVALEAMACALTVVATAVGGLVGTIDDGRTGFLVPPGDVEALADVLVQVLPDAVRRRAIGRAARERVERDFSWSRSIEATLGVYREVLS
jgi:glycosyltransferase involved in cell wall biosynthesis